MGTPMSFRLYSSFYNRWFYRKHLIQFIPGHCPPWYILCGSAHPLCNVNRSSLHCYRKLCTPISTILIFTVNVSKNSLCNFICSSKYDLLPSALSLLFRDVTTLLPLPWCTHNVTYFIYRLFHSVAAVMLIIFIIYEAFVSRWDISVTKTTTTNREMVTNLEWFHSASSMCCVCRGYPCTCEIRKESNPCQLVSSQHNMSFSVSEISGKNFVALSKSNH